ncbi:MAG: erythromycin esterase family protein [Fimbriimonadaceae bacterium]|nr:erythromycin esterase family protein [Fimbriimonadaceae bacterium]QYK57086.1 MAG: erythromycin esterase family protein [Fimbriimonadaceae bacterium]
MTWLAAIAIGQTLVAQHVALEGDDYADLGFLRQELRGKSLVQLGEATHGTAEFYLLKTRLVKFLHDELGYDTLILESGALETNLAMAQRNGLSDRELMESTVFDNFCWKEALPLFTYIKSRPKLRVLGMDPQFSSDAVLTLVSDLIKPYEPSLAEEAAKRLGEGYQFLGKTDQPEEFNKARDSYLEWLKDFDKKLGSIRFKTAERVASSTLRQAVKDLRRYWNYRPDTPLVERMALRDQIMAERTLAGLGKGRAVVWAHNGHIGRGLGYRILGDTLRDKLGAKTYAIGLFAREGEFYAHWERAVRPLPAAPDGLPSKFPAEGEAWFATTSAFREPLAAAEPENGGVLTFVPADRFDAVVSVSRSTAPTRLPR